jgi:hypothetical protein
MGGRSFIQISLIDGTVNRGTKACPSSSEVEPIVAGHHSGDYTAEYSCFSNEVLKNIKIRTSVSI